MENLASDRLAMMFDVQKQFEYIIFDYYNRDFGKLSHSDKQAETMRICLSLIKEATEILDCINWKKHRVHTQKKVSESDLLEEIIDVFKYLLIICLIWDIDVDKFCNGFLSKTSVVFQRFEQERLLKLVSEQKQKICAVDLDGVLYPWPEAFIEFVNDSLDPDMQLKNLYDFDALPLRMKLDFKEKYRLSKAKSTANVINGASEFTTKLRELGYTIIILTSRPYRKYHVIYNNTINWLVRHNIVFDAIIWEEEKEKYLVDKFPQTEFIVEDDIDNVKKLVQCGSLIFLKNTIYNANKVINSDNVIRFDDFTEIINRLTIQSKGDII